MRQCDPARANKQRGGYSARPVFCSGAGGMLGNFAARRGAADRRGGSGWADLSAAAGGVDAGQAASTPHTQNQWFSSSGDGQVARGPSHGGDEMADFCGFSGRRRKIVSYQTADLPGGLGPLAGPRKGHWGTSIWAKSARRGGLSPFGSRPDAYPGRARQIQVWGETAPLRPWADSPMRGLGRGAILSFVPMGSGVWVSLKREGLRAESACLRQWRAEFQDAVHGQGPLGLGYARRLESRVG